MQDRAQDGDGCCCSSTAAPARPARRRCSPLELDGAPAGVTAGTRHGDGRRVRTPTAPGTRPRHAGRRARRSPAADAHDRRRGQGDGALDAAAGTVALRATTGRLRALEPRRGRRGRARRRRRRPTRRRRRRRPTAPRRARCRPHRTSRSSRTARALSRQLRRRPVGHRDRQAAARPRAGGKRCWYFSGGKRELPAHEVRHRRRTSRSATRPTGPTCCPRGWPGPLRARRVAIDGAGNRTPLGARHARGWCSPSDEARSPLLALLGALARVAGCGFGAGKKPAATVT